MRRSCIQLHGLVVAVICLIPPASALAQAPSAIQIFMPNGGLPPTAIRMTLIRDDGYSDIVFTDSKGKFQISTPRGQTAFYRIIIEGDRLTYDTTTANLTLDRNVPNQLNIFLKALSTAKLPAHAVLDITRYDENVPSKARAAYKRAMEAVKNGQTESAIDNLQQAVSLHPQYVRALNDLGVVYLKLARLEEAAATFRRTIEVSKRFLHPRLNLGIVLSRQGKYKEAVEILAPLYSENHGMLEVRLAYGDALKGAGDFIQAEKIYLSTLESKYLDPQHLANLHLSLGVVLDRQGKYAEAIMELDKAIAIEDSAKSHLQLGFTLMELQKFDRAERELLRSYELGGGTTVAVAQSYLGQIYYTQNRYEDARKAFERYLTDMPEAPDAARINKLIAELKLTPRN